MVLLLAMIIVIGLTFIVTKSKTIGISGIGVLVILVAIRIIADLAEGFSKRSKRLEKRAVRGAVAEEAIGQMLDSLEDGYLVIHDVRSNYGNIDHVVISETGGLFLIETKSHGGRVEVDGERLLVNGKPPEKDFIGQTLQNTYWLKGEIKKLLGLDVWTTPVLVFTNAFVPFGMKVKGVSIINKRYLSITLTKIRGRNSANNKLWSERDTLMRHLR